MTFTTVKESCMLGYMFLVTSYADRLMKSNGPVATPQQ